MLTDLQNLYRGELAPQQRESHESAGWWRARTGAERATSTTCYFRPFSDVAEAFALPGACSAVFVGGTCGINGLIR